MSGEPPIDPQRVTNWVARFITSSGTLLETVRYQNCTNRQALDLANERQAYHGYHCDDYTLNEDTHPQNR